MKVQFPSHIKPIVVDLRKIKAQPQTGQATNAPEESIVIVHRDPTTRQAAAQFWLSLRLLLRTVGKRIRRLFSVVNHVHDTLYRGYLARRGEKHRS